MTIIKRLRISYVLLVVIPFVIFITGGIILEKDFFNKVVEMKLSIQTEKFNNYFYKTIGDNPDSLFYEETLNDILNLTKNPDNIVIYLLVDGIIEKSYGKNFIPDFDDIHEIKYVNYWYFNNSAGNDCEIIIFDNSFNKRYPIIPLLLVIIIYTSMIIILSIITASKITNPLKKLKIAANSIKEEDFDIDLEYSENDEIKSVFNAFDDMSVRLKANVEKQLNYERNRNELISNISHDLKTPITSIKGYIEGLKDGVANTPEKVARYHQTIYKKVNLLDKLIENLFLFSKLDLKTVPFNFQKIDLQTYIKDIIEEIKYDEPDIDINLIEFTNNVYVSIDPIHLQRVFHNLIGNAKKYNNKGLCKVEISTEISGDFINISIADNGPGVQNCCIENIFKRFFRSDPARSSSTEGSGLGLAISKHIIDEHNGEISAYNNSEGGLTVVFSIPTLED